jgi:hypothetical protein
MHHPHRSLITALIMIFSASSCVALCEFALPQLANKTGCKGGHNTGVHREAPRYDLYNSKSATTPAMSAGVCNCASTR